MSKEKEKIKHGNKMYEKEWSFSLDGLGDSLSGLGDSIGNLIDSVRSDSDENVELKAASFSEPIGGATRADVGLNLSIGEVTISRLLASDNLFEADVTYQGDMEFSVTGDEQKVIKLREKNRTSLKTISRIFGSIAKREDLRWDVRLSPDVPLALNLKGGVGSAEIDLSGLNLQSFAWHGGVGESEIMLPASTAGYDVSVKGGVGKTDLTLIEGTTANVSINGGVGMLRVHVPEGLAVRVIVKGNLGDVAMPVHFVKLKDTKELVSMGGEWQTEGFEEAEHQVNIHFNGGVGSFRIV